MSLLVWDQPGTRTFESSVDQGVLYLDNGWGMPWNGLALVEENSNLESPRLSYQNGEPYKTRAFRGAYSARILAFTYPQEFEDYRGTFGLSYRTRISSDLDIAHGYKLHIVYGAKARVNNPSYSDEESVAPFSWDVTTTPIKIPRMRATSHISLDSTKTDPAAMAELETILYGSDDILPHLPTVKELFEIFNLGPIFIVTDNGDGTFTVEGPDEMIQMIQRGTFQLDSESVIHLGEGLYTVSSV